jgi:hypothetical protein
MMFRRVAPAAPRAVAAAAATTAQRTMIMIHDPVDCSSQQVRVETTSANHSGYLMPGFCVSGCAFFVAKGIMERGSESSESQGLAFWFGKFTLARYQAYHEPAYVRE